MQNNGNEDILTEVGGAVLGTVMPSGCLKTPAKATTGSV